MKPTQVLSWAKFQPRGCRGVNGTGVDGRYGTYPGAEYFRKANAESVVAIQIEHKDAVAEVEQIAALPDLDFLFIGPADLSQSMGLTGQWDHPEMWKAIERVAKAAAANQLPWAVLPLNAAHAAPVRRSRLPDSVAGDRRLVRAEGDPGIQGGLCGVLLRLCSR